MAAKKTIKKKRVPRHMYFDPVYRGMHPVPVPGVTSSFVSPTIRHAGTFTTGGHHHILMYTFSASLYRLVLWKSGNNVRTFEWVGNRIQPQPVDIRALCASLRLTNVTRNDACEGFVQTLVTNDPMDVTIDENGVMQGWQKIRDMFDTHGKAKSFSASFFQKERKFVAGPGPQTEYKSYVPYSDSDDVNLNVAAFAASCRRPHSESIIIHIPYNANAQTYRFVLDEQTAQRHVPGTVIHQMQQNPQQHNRGPPRAPSVRRGRSPARDEERFRQDYIRRRGETPIDIEI